MRSILVSLATFTLLALPAVAQSAPRAADPAETMLRRGAYQETQKQEPAKAIEIYREVVRRYPDSPFAKRAQARIAALEKPAGEKPAGDERAKQPAPPIPNDLPKELRAKVERIIEDGRKKGETREEIRARVQKLLEEVKAKRDEAKRDGKPKSKAKPKKGRLV